MKFLFLFLCVLLSACSNLPIAITDAPSHDIQVNQISGKSAEHTGQAVRWGGIITEVENGKDSTGVQVLSYPLGLYGRPISYQDTGRFYFKTPEFLDPAVYKKGTEITIFGFLNGNIAKTIGEKTLTLAVVDAKEIHLWRNYRAANYNYAGYGYGPYRYGFSGFYGHGSYGHGYHGFGRFGRFSRYGGYGRYACY